MRMFITSINKYLSNGMKIFGTCSIPLKVHLLPLFVVNVETSATGSYIITDHTVSGQNEERYCSPVTIHGSLCLNQHIYFSSISFNNVPTDLISSHATHIQKKLLMINSHSLKCGTSFKMIKALII